jgi:hypothetical protein
VRPIAEVAYDQRLAEFEVARDPGAVVGRFCGQQGRGLDPPVGEVLGELLITVGDAIRQVSGSGRIRPRNPKVAIVSLPRRRQASEQRAAVDPAGVVQIDKVAGIEVGVMGLASAAGAVRLTR